MKVNFVCNLNQARSQVLHAVIKQLHPELQVDSFGVIATEGAPLPLVIESILEEWGLPRLKKTAKNLILHQAEVLESDLVVCMTDFIETELRILGFKGQIVNLEKLADSAGIALLDPQLMRRSQCAYELSKYIHVAQSSLQNVGVLPTSPISKAFIPQTEASIPKAFELALAECDDTTCVLYADLIAPRNDLHLPASLECVRYRIDSKTSEGYLEKLPSPPMVFLPSNSIFLPSKFYISKMWTDFLSGVNAKKLFLITPPLESGFRMIQESYLAARGAGEIRVVS
jgi:protein-tyrosine-phosphatase